MTPPPDLGPLDADTEALFREGLRTAPSMIASTDRYRYLDLVSITTAAWADRCRCLLATLDAERARSARDEAGPPLDPDPLDVTDATAYDAGYVAGWWDSADTFGRPPLLGYVLVALSATVMTALIAVAVMAGLR